MLSFLRQRFGLFVQPLCENEPLVVGLNVRSCLRLAPAGSLCDLRKIAFSPSACNRLP